MPFDGTGYHEPRTPRATPKENVILVACFAFALFLMALPISLGGCVDLVRYFRGG
jgi:hypothetical protein